MAVKKTQGGAKGTVVSIARDYLYIIATVVVLIGGIASGAIGWNQIQVNTSNISILSENMERKFGGKIETLSESLQSFQKTYQKDIQNTNLYRQEILHILNGVKAFMMSTLPDKQAEILKDLMNSKPYEKNGYSN